MSTATVATPATAVPALVRLVPTAADRHRRRQPVAAMSWRVLGPDGRTLGWVQLAYVRATGQAAWAAAAPYGGCIPIHATRPRGRDAVAALMAHHGLEEVG